MSDTTPVIILIVSKSFGEVDWILPVLVQLKRHNPEWRVITLFSHKLIYEFLTLNRALFAEFKKISSMNIVPQEIGSLFRDEIRPEQVKMVLKDYNEDQYSPYKLEVMRHCPQALLVSYPHSNHIYSNRATDSVQPCAAPDAYSVHDLFLLCSAEDIPYWSEFVDYRKIRTFGYPRYDSWWMKSLADWPELTASEECQRARRADKVFFYISRGPHSHYLSQADYEYLLRSTMEEVLAYDNSFLLIKPHPRQDTEDLARLLAPYDARRWMVSGLHLQQLCTLAEVVISGWSSGILDALAVGKPVIEFWRFGGNDPLVRYTSDGRPTTIYRELGLAAPAESRDELAVLLRSAVQTPAAPIWQGQQQAFRRYCKTTDNAAQEIADCLLAETERKGKATLIPQGRGPAEMVELLMGYVTHLVEEGATAKAEQWLAFLAGQFPDDPQVLNNHGVFLFNQGEVDRAVDNLAKAVTLDPAYLEAAVNLIQVLLALDRLDAAMEIVISLYGRTATTGNSYAFLHALSDQLEPAQFASIQQRLAAIKEESRPQAL